MTANILGGSHFWRRYLSLRYLTSRNDVLPVNVWLGGPAEVWMILSQNSGNWQSQYTIVFETMALSQNRTITQCVIHTVSITHSSKNPEHIHWKAELERGWTIWTKNSDNCRCQGDMGYVFSLRKSGEVVEYVLCAQEMNFFVFRYMLPFE